MSIDVKLHLTPIHWRIRSPMVGVLIWSRRGSFMRAADQAKGGSVERVGFPCQQWKQVDDMKDSLGATVDEARILLS